MLFNRFSILTEVLYLFIIINITAIAQPADSIKYKIPEVIVTAIRSNVELNHLPFSAAVINAKEIQSFNGFSAASALAGEMDVIVRSYGAGEAMQSVSLRGLGTDLTLVLIDGKRYNDAQNGTVDFSLLQSENIERIEILHGGYSSLFGADAVGGVVNIVTKRPLEGYSASAKMGFGSFGQKIYGVSTDYANDQYGLRSFYQKILSNGDYEFNYHSLNQTILSKRKDSDYIKEQFGASLDLYAIQDHKTSISVQIINAARGAAGPLFSLTDDSKARMSDRDIFLQLDHTWSINPSTRLIVNSSARFWDEHYTDPNPFWQMDYMHQNRAVRFSPILQYSFENIAVGTLGWEFSEMRLKSDGAVGEPIRVQQSIFSSADIELATGMNIPYRINIFPSIRIDASHSEETGINARVGINAGLLREPELFIRFSYGSSYRAPTFNDLYYVTGGNPNLKPERSIGFDAGIGCVWDLFGKWETKIDFYDVAKRDQIVWAPTSSGLWAPMNIQKARSRGIGGDVTARLFNEQLILGVNYSVLDARIDGSVIPHDPTIGKILRYTPDRTANARIGLQNSWGELNIVYSYIGSRFTSDDNSAELPSYNTVDVNATARFQFNSIRMWVKAEVSNLFNEDYVVISDYPMPLRNFMLTLGTEI